MAFLNRTCCKCGAPANFHNGEKSYCSPCFKSWGRITRLKITALADQLAAERSVGVHVTIPGVANSHIWQELGEMGLLR